MYCHICAKTISPWKLKSHLKSHSETAVESKRNELKAHKEYSCRYCGLKFDKVNNRTSHENRIHKSKLNLGFENFKCKICDLIFKTQEELREHGFQHFSGKIHFCDFPGCNRQFKKGKLLTVHKKCHYEPQVKCLGKNKVLLVKNYFNSIFPTDCGQMFVQRSGLLKHQKYGRCSLKKINKKEVVTESDAKLAQDQFVALKGRLKLNIDTKSYEVFEEFDKLSDIEGSQENTVIINNDQDGDEWHYEYLDENLIESIEDDNESNPFEALNEDNFNDNVEDSNIKIEGVTKKISPPKSRKPRSPKKIQKQPYECDFCGKKFISRSSIFSHLLVTHKSAADYNCMHCSRKFKSTGNLTRHIKAMHTSLRHWNCDKCGALFKQKYQLEIHLHNHDQPSKCEICSKIVKNLKVHLRHHSMKKNNFLVECSLCSKRVGKYQLMRHIKRVHEKAFQKETSTSCLKIYNCNDCGEYFSRQQELRQHEYISHSQNKIYECTICGNVFRKLKLLNVHRFTHQPQNVKCKLCNNVYARKAALYKHMKKHHPESYVNPRNKNPEWDAVEWNTEL